MEPENEEDFFLIVGNLLLSACEAFNLLYLKLYVV